jgi:hypothetical protein
MIEIIKPNSKPFAIVASYRSPEFSPDLFFDQMTTIIKQLEHESKDIFIFGDLNCDLLGNRSHRETSLLNSLAQIYQLHQLIDEPTRCTRQAPEH